MPARSCLMPQSHDDPLCCVELILAGGSKTWAVAAAHSSMGDCSRPRSWSLATFCASARSAFVSMDAFCWKRQARREQDSTHAILGEVCARYFNSFGGLPERGAVSVCRRNRTEWGGQVHPARSSLRAAASGLRFRNDRWGRLVCQLRGPEGGIRICAAG
jgi:hypothetical protein